MLAQYITAIDSTAHHCTTLHCLCFPLSLSAMKHSELLGAMVGNIGNAMHAVRTQCEVLDVGQYSDPTFGPF